MTQTRTRTTPEDGRPLSQGEVDLAIKYMRDHGLAGAEGWRKARKYAREARPRRATSGPSGGEFTDDDLREALEYLRKESLSGDEGWRKAWRYARSQRQSRYRRR